MESGISSIKIIGLFGKFNYDISVEDRVENLTILYGDNGVGKSTILKLVFDVLSPANDRGHRTSLLKTKFENILIILRNGFSVEVARRPEIGNGAIRLRTKKNTETITEWIHSERNSRTFPEGLDLEYDLFEEGIAFDDSAEMFRIFQARGNRTKRKPDTVKRGSEPFLAHLSKICPKLYFLNADRKLVSDEVPNGSDEMQIRHALRHTDVKRMSEMLETFRANSLNAALMSAARWINKRVVSGANRGSEDVHNAYVSILSQLSIQHHYESEKVEEKEIAELILQLKRIEKITKDYSKFELAVSLKMSDFIDALETQDSKANTLAAQLIRPYINSLKARLEAINNIYQQLDIFVLTINSFLTGKQIKYGLSQGFYIVDDFGDPLEAGSLSSGEQQLLLIFAHVLSARDEASVFIIDEPEISLNVKWQRKIVSSLLDVAGNSSIQFIFASHSFEIIAQHRQAVVKVAPQ